MGSAVLHVEDGLCGKGPRAVRRLRASRRPLAYLCVVALVVALAATARSVSQGGQTGEAEVKKADIVFVIDATGSMGDEIEDVKASLMGIGNRLAHRKPQPDVRFGAVFYRDESDREIVRTVPLSHDLAAVRDAIMDVRATGGGDWPEHVGIGLHKALEMDWSHTDSEGSVRLIYLVADAPPQQYDDGYDVPAALKLARSMGVKVQVIGCSGLDQGKPAMRGIAEQTGGTYSDFERQKGCQDKRLHGDRTRSAEPPPRRGFIPPPPPPHTGATIGVDFGGSYSYAGVWSGGDIADAEVIVHAMSSFVAHNGSGFRVVQPHEPKAFFDAKYLLGQTSCKRCRFKNLTARLPFRVQLSEGQAMIPALDGAGRKVLLHPEVAAAETLSQVKAAASAHLGQEVTRAVLTVPTWFNDRQRQAVKDAGMAAGMNILRVVNEPTAAVTAYGLDLQNDKCALVVHCGASSIDISALSTDTGVTEVLFEVSDERLTGRALDQRVLEHVLSEYHREHGHGVPEDDRFRQRLSAQVESAKRELSSAMQVGIEVEAPDGFPNVRMTITRDRFEQLVEDLFEVASESLERVERLLIEEAELELKQVDDLVFSGGSMHIPKLRTLVEGVVGKKSRQGIEPEEIIAKGAATIAGRLGSETFSGADLLLMDVTPLTIGVEVAGGLMQPVITRNSVIPISKSMLLTTLAENQTSLQLRIFEGERPLTKDNHLLTEVNVTGVARAAAEGARIQLQLDIDPNGILHVIALDLVSGRLASTVMTFDESRLNEEEIEQMIKDSERFAAEDKSALEELQGAGHGRCWLASEQIPLVALSEDVTHFGTLATSSIVLPRARPAMAPTFSSPPGLSLSPDRSEAEEDPEDLGRLSKLLYANIVDEL